MLSRTNK